MSNFKVCIDIGHGLNTPGKRTSTLLGKVYNEHELNSKVASYLIEELCDRNIQFVTTTRLNSAVDVSLKERCNISNVNKCDLFISLHHNAAGRLSKTASGIVLYKYSTKNTKDALTLYTYLIRYGGIKGNRSTPIVSNTSLYVLKHTSATAFLIECGFMDSIIDYPIITSVEYSKKIAHGIAEFIDYKRRNS